MERGSVPNLTVTWLVLRRSTGLMSLRRAGRLRVLAPKLRAVRELTGRDTFRLYGL